MKRRKTRTSAARGVAAVLAGFIGMALLLCEPGTENVTLPAVMAVKCAGFGLIYLAFTLAGRRVNDRSDKME